jgi:hypothetical protein
MNTECTPRERCYTALIGKAASLPNRPKNPVKLDQVPAGENVGLLLEHANLSDDLALDSDGIKAILPGFVPANTLTIGRGVPLQARGGIKGVSMPGLLRPGGGRRRLRARDERFGLKAEE